MIGRRSFCGNHQLSILYHKPFGYTLVEVVTVALVISILACVAVPRLNLGAVWGARADAAVQRLVTDLRHTRTLAITHAARNPSGFALVMQGTTPGRSYQIINRGNHTAATTCTLPPDLRCNGDQYFQFGPLGNLQSGSDTRLRLQTKDRVYLIEIAPATGAVEWRRCNDKE